MTKIFFMSFWAMIFTFSGISLGEDGGDGVFDNTIPLALQEIVGAGAWFYVWPHGYLPLTEPLCLGVYRHRVAV